MSFTYVKEKIQDKKKKQNAFLEEAITKIAKKYNIVKKGAIKRDKRNKGDPIVLYDFKKNECHRRNTLKLIAKQSSLFIADIPNNEHVVGVGASKYASCRQIRFLLDDNSGQTSVNTVILLCTIFKLLQYSTDSAEFKAIIHDNAKNDNDYTDYVPESFLPPALSVDDMKSCAKCFLEEKMRKILEGGLTLPSIQIYLANYIRACSDCLDNLVTSRAKTAVIIGQGYPEKQCEIRDIQPTDMPHFPYY